MRCWQIRPARLVPASVIVFLGGMALVQTARLQMAEQRVREAEAVARKLTDRNADALQERRAWTVSFSGALRQNQNLSADLALLQRRHGDLPCEESKSFGCSGMRTVTSEDRERQRQSEREAREWMIDAKIRLKRYAALYGSLGAWMEEK